jgi:hypothetical protein
MEIDKMLRIAFSLVATCAIGLSSAKADDAYSPRDFFAAAPANFFYTDDEMGEEDKAAIIKGGYKKKAEFDCSSWGVEKESKNELVLRYCPDSSVTIFVYNYANDPKSALVVASSTRGSSGQANDLDFYRATKGQKEFTILSDKERIELGLTPLTDNDFLKESNRFPASEVEPAPFWLDDNGIVRALPHLWMNTRWEHKKIDFNIHFVWDQNRFKLVRTDAPKE